MAQFPSGRRPALRPWTSGFVLLMATTAAWSQSQLPQPAAPPYGYPTQAGAQPYPSATYPSTYGASAPGDAQGRTTRGIFLGTILSLMAQGVGSSASQGLSGTITRWFNGTPSNGATATTAPAVSVSTNTGVQPTANGGAAALGFGGTVVSSNPGAGSTAAPMGYAGTPVAVDGTPAATPGWSTVPQASGGAQIPGTAQMPPAGDLYAGIAYEVHLLAADGSTQLVDPGSYAFRTGDRFVVHYRPNLPGRVELFNINPRGVESSIDNVEVAGGQLVTLGPYEFADVKGDEVLKIVLNACQSDRLLRATRNIVKVSAAARSVASPTAVDGATTRTAEWRLPTCGSALAAQAMRSARRDIRRVVQDGPTTFALDPIDRQEMNNGALAPRNVVIRLMHR